MYQGNTKSVSWREVDGDAVVVHAETSVYFSLNNAGTFLWKLLVEAPHGSQHLADKLARRYGLDSETAEAEVDVYLRQLTEAELLTVGQIESGANSTLTTRDEEPGPVEASVYEPPELVKFGDLETLILSGE